MGRTLFIRSVIFPIRQKNAKDTAVIVVSSAILFNIINGFINGYYLGSENLVQSSIIITLLHLTLL